MVSVMDACNRFLVIYWVRFPLLKSPILGKYEMKEGYSIVPISKREMEYLLSKGYKFHDKIFKTYSGNKKYSACEEYYVMKLLDEYRKSKIILSKH